MLVLTRDPGDSLIMDLGNGSDVRLTVLRVDGNQVRLGIEAPKDVAIAREELLVDAAADTDAREAPDKANPTPSDRRTSRAAVRGPDDVIRLTSARGAQRPHDDE